MLRIFFPKLLKATAGKAFQLAVWLMDVSRYAEGTLAALFFLLVSVLAQAQNPWTTCPDGKYYPAGECRRDPTGEWTTAPGEIYSIENRWVPDYGQGITLSPDGRRWMPRGPSVYCLDNEWHYGNRCVRLPDGREMGVLDSPRRERDQARQERDAEKAKKDQYVQDLIAADRKFKAMKQQIIDAEEVYREQIKEMERRIRAEERARPLTTEEEQTAKARIEELERQHSDLSAEIGRQRSEAQVAVNLLKQEREALKRQLADEKSSVALYTKAVSAFQKAAVRYREDVIAIITAADALKRITMPDTLAGQVEHMRELTRQALTALENVGYVQRD